MALGLRSSVSRYCLCVVQVLTVQCSAELNLAAVLFEVYLLTIRQSISIVWSEL